MNTYRYRTINALMIAVLSVVLSSCGIYKPYQRDLDNAYMKQFDEAITDTAEMSGLPYLGWEQVFTDPVLQGYIRTALANNKDIDNAVKNIDIARAQLKGAKLSYLPSVALNPNGGAAKYGDSKMDTWTYTIPMSISWEVDLFGKILNRKRGAQISVEQMQDYLQAVRSQIICGVVNCYYSMMLLNQQIDLSQRTADIWKDQVEAMRLMKEAGRVTEAAVVQSEANYYSILASIPDMRNSLHKLQNTMALLLHDYPREYAVSSTMDFNLPVVIGDGVPMSYLAARPDVRAAERSVAAAYYATSSARAAFYPSLTISSNGGFTNLLGSMVVNPGKWFIQLAGQLAAPLFARGQNIANLEVAKTRQAQAMNDFEVKVLSAAADVSDALASYRFNREKREYLMQQIDKLEKSVEYTQELMMYNAGTTYLEVLTAQSGLLSAQLSALACWHDKVSALISLYQAVGGGR